MCAARHGPEFATRNWTLGRFAKLRRVHLNPRQFTRRRNDRECAGRRLSGGDRRGEPNAIITVGERPRRALEDAALGSMTMEREIPALASLSFNDDHHPVVQDDDPR